VVAIGFGVLGLLGLLYWGAPNQDLAETGDARPGTDAVVPAGTVESGPVVERYLRALQLRNCDDVVRMTRWMQDRLAVARERGEAESEARAALCEQIREWNPAESRILPEGIRDAYLITPEATWQAVRIDEGNPRLAYPAAERTWMRVNYSLKTRAPKDKEGNPVHALTVGINVDSEGRVLKAGVLGTLEIDYESFEYEW
jgi:hypothetical protein